MTGDNRYERILVNTKQKGVATMKDIIPNCIERGIEQGIERGIEQGIERGMKQGIERGMKQGLQEGIEQGTQQGVEKMNSLIKKLLEDHREDDIAKVTSDETYRNEMFKNYNI